MPRLAVLVPFLSYLMARAALRPLRTSYEAQQRFVDDASHEFRTPLSVLQGEMELALSLPRPREEYEQVLERSLEEVQTLISLTENLLLLARGSAADMTATFEEVSLAEIAQAAAHARRSGWQRAGRRRRSRCMRTPESWAPRTSSCARPRTSSTTPMRLHSADGRNHHHHRDAGQSGNHAHRGQRDRDGARGCTARL